MTEQDWNEAAAPEEMLALMSQKRLTSPRALRVVVCAACRQLWQLFQDDVNRAAIELAEGQADRLVSQKKVRSTRRERLAQLQEGMGWRDEDAEFMLGQFRDFHFEDSPAWVQRMAATIAAVRSLEDAIEVRHLRQALSLLADTQPSSRKYPVQAQCRQRQAVLLRDIFGPLPFRPVTLDPSWLAPPVPELTRAIYEERELPSGHLNNERLAVLADCLEEKGCDNQEVLSHLRQQGAVHVRGCWCVDLLLNKR